MLLRILRRQRVATTPQRRAALLWTRCEPLHTLQLCLLLLHLCRSTSSFRSRLCTDFYDESSNTTMTAEVPYSSPIPPQFYGPLAAVFVMAGLAFMSVSFMQQMNARREQSAAKDLPLALTSSAFLGFGSLFVLLWSGVYV